ncbi:MAG: threonine synthase [Candidatus Geothermarchaeales archaeon]
MFTEGLICTRCRSEFPHDEKIWLCEKCGSILDVVYDYDKIRDKVNKKIFQGRERSTWRYKEFLPISRGEDIVSLGEGGTPTVKARAYGERFGLKNLYFKLEYLNPTGSFKDRGSTTLVSKAKEIGVRRLVEDSSGNAGSSIAAYCAKAGIDCTIFTPSSAPAGKLAQILIYGAGLERIRGTRGDVARAVREYYEKEKVYYGSHNVNPFFTEGVKSLAFEISEWMGWGTPDHIVFPVGGGTLLYGTYKGLRELLGMDWIDDMPRLHCVQSDACMPIVNAYDEGLEHVVGVEERETVAGGVRIARPAKGLQVLRGIRETRGSAVAVSDEEVLYQQRALARLEGIFVEPTSCVTLAGLIKLLERGEIDGGETIILPLTGFGLKDLEVAKGQVGL